MAPGFMKRAFGRSEKKPVKPKDSYGAKGISECKPSSNYAASSMASERATSPYVANQAPPISISRNTSVTSSSVAHSSMVDKKPPAYAPPASTPEYVFIPPPKSQRESVLPYRDIRGESQWGVAWSEDEKSAPPIPARNPIRPTPSRSDTTQTSNSTRSVSESESPAMDSPSNTWPDYPDELEEMDAAPRKSSETLSFDLKTELPGEVEWPLPPSMKDEGAKPHEVVDREVRMGFRLSSPFRPQSVSPTKGFG